MAQQANDHVDVCFQVPDEAMAADSIDTTMFGTTSLLSFSELIEHVPIDAVIKVVYKYKESKANHFIILLSSGLMVSNCVAACRLSGADYRAGTQ